MESGAATASRRGWQLWALLPILLLVGAVSLFAAAGGSIVDLVGTNPPPADELDIRRVTFEPGRIEIRVTNPQRDAITIGTVTVADAIVPYTVDGPTTLERLRSATIVVPYDWVRDEPISVGVTSSTGIQVTEDIAAAVETPGADSRSVFGYALIGFLVGVVPVALGLMWLPALRGADPRWLAAFMALTAAPLPRPPQPTNPTRNPSVPAAWAERDRLKGMVSAAPAASDVLRNVRRVVMARCSQIELCW